MNCHPLGAYVLPKMAHTRQAFEIIVRVLAAPIIGSHIRGETSVWACVALFYPPPMAFSSSRATGVLVLHGTSFRRQNKGSVIQVIQIMLISCSISSRCHHCQEEQK